MSALNIIKAYAKKSLTKNRGSGIMELPSDMIVENRVGEIAALLQKAGIPVQQLDDYIRSEKDLLKYLNIIDATSQPTVYSGQAAIDQLNKFLGKKGEVVDMKGKKLDPGKPIVGGTQDDTVTGIMTQVDDRMQNINKANKKLGELLREREIMYGKAPKTKDNPKVQEREMFKEANERFNQQDVVADTVTKMISMEPVAAMKEANKIIKRDGIYKNLTKEQSQKILKDTDDWIFQRDPSDRWDYNKNRPFRDDPNFDPDDPSYDPDDYAQGGRARHYAGGIIDVEPNLSDIGHGSDSLMSRTRLMSPGAQATTSTGLNYLLAEDNDNLRVPFASGTDLGRRAFMKLMAALTGGVAAVKSGIVGLGGGATKKTAAKEIIKTVNAPGKPEWFDTLVTKIINEGEDVTKQFGYKERMIVHTKPISKTEEVTVYRDLDDNSVRINYGKKLKIDDTKPYERGNIGRASNDPDQIDLIVREGEVIEPDLKTGKGGGKTKASFEASEAEPRAVGGPEDADIEFDGIREVDNVDDLMQDVSSLEEFATGKKLTGDKAAKAKKKREDFQRFTEDQVEQANYLEEKYGPYDDSAMDDFASGGRVPLWKGSMVESAPRQEKQKELDMRKGIYELYKKRADDLKEKRDEYYNSPEYHDDSPLYPETNWSLIEALENQGKGTPYVPKEEKYIVFDDGTVYYPQVDEYYKQDGTQVTSPSEGAKPVPKTMEAAEGGRIGFSAGKSLAAYLADRTITGSSRRFLEKVFGKERLTEMNKDPDLYRGLLEVVEMFRKRDKEGLKIYMQKFLPHMDDATVEEFIVGTRPDIEGIQGQLLRLGSGRDYKGKIEMMKEADNMRKLDALDVSKMKPNAEGGRIGKWMGGGFTAGKRQLSELLKFMAKDSTHGKSPSEMLRMINPKQFNEMLNRPEGIPSMAKEMIEQYTTQMKGDRANMIADLISTGRRIKKADDSIINYKIKIVEDMVSKGADRKTAERMAETLATIMEQQVGKKATPKITDQGLLEMENIQKNLVTKGRKLQAAGGLTTMLGE